MNYKRIYALIFTFAFISCEREDFLDRFPKDRVFEQTYFGAESDLKLYANQFYDFLPAEFSSNDNASDNMVPNNREPFLSGSYTIPASGGGWDWGNIRAVNFFLTRNNKPELSDEIKNIYNGEVRFFRALFYWQLVVRFGDVPIYTTDLNEKSPELYAPRDNHKDVMDFVLEDLNFAVANLPDPTSENRVHKYAALALKSRICLWEGTFRKYHAIGGEQVFLQEAAAASLEIINSGRYDIYSTGNPTEDYRNLFIQEDLSDNKESILSRFYITNINTSSYTRTAGENLTGFSKDFVRSYLSIDGLPTALSPLYQGDDTPEEEVANRDPRYAQTIATPGYVYTESPGNNVIIERPLIGTSATSTGYQAIKGRSSDPALVIANQDNIDKVCLSLCRSVVELRRGQSRAWTIGSECY